MNKETEMKLDTIIALLRNLNSDSIDRVISELEVELRSRDDEEQDKQDYDDLLARQYEADQVDDFLRRGSMLHGRTNALEGIK